MATLYFGWPSGEYAGYWGTLSNWFTNSACTIPAAALPTINDHVVIQPQPGTPLSAQGSAGVAVIDSNATAASLTLIDTRPLGPGNFALVCGIDLTVSGNITSSGVDLYNNGAVVCGGTITFNSPNTPGSFAGVSVVFAPMMGGTASITCSQLIVNDSRLVLQGYGSIVGNVQGNNTQISLIGSGHVQSRANSIGVVGFANLGIIYPMYGVMSIAGNLTLSNGYSVMFKVPPDQTGYYHAGCLVTGNVTMTKTSLFAGTANGTGYMDIDSLIAAHKYQGSEPIGPIYNPIGYFDCGVYGGGVVAVYDKGINGSSILGVV